LVPKEFAARLLQSRTGRVEGERRIVTILFCDVKGSTALGDERDPEEILEIMNGAFDFLIEPVYRYEGTLARLMGDAILAFFGAPIAHEDDPERACLAALAMQEKIAEYAKQIKRTHGIENFAVRVGINTGLVVVGEVGSDLRVEYTAMGDAINLASRMEQSAEPGTIVIAENTARLARHAIELESLGALQVKGKAEPVNAYRVVGVKAERESTRGIVGLTSPLVGREKEIREITERLDALRAGRGQLVAVIGEAGLGKSR
ncbi:MAG: guanylate cyclase, partial [Chloroflexi bacterium]